MLAFFMNKSKGEMTKNKIIEAALDCFYQNGFEETTFQRIAKKIDMTQPSLYKYFNNKMHLASECSLWAARKGRDFIDNHMDPKKPALARLEQYVEASFLFFDKFKKETYILSALCFFSQTDEIIKKSFVAIQIQSIQRYEAVLLNISYEKNMQLQNSLQLAEMFQSIMIGEIYKQIYFLKKNDIPDHVQTVMKTFNTLIDSHLK